MTLLPLLHVAEGTTAVGHVPIDRYLHFFVFLGMPGASITCSVAGSCGCRNVLVLAK